MYTGVINQGALQEAVRMKRHLHKHAVGADAGLPGVAESAADDTRRRRVHVSVVEHDEGGVPSQLQADLLHGVCGARVQHLADARGAREPDLAHGVALQQRVA